VATALSTRLLGTRRPAGRVTAQQCPGAHTHTRCNWLLFATLRPQSDAAEDQHTDDRDAATCACDRAAVGVERAREREDEMNDRLLTAAEVADYLGLKPGTVLDKWERGEIPGFKFGRAVRFNLDEVLATGRPGGGEETPVTPPRPANRVVSVLPVTRSRGEEHA
jgi:excisionase family DNA binding protein